MKKLILSVDDDEDIRKTIKDVLEHNGFKVTNAVNGDDLFVKLKKIKPDLILLDVLMPGKSTKDILIEFKKQNIKIPIIFVSCIKLTEVVKKELISGVVVDYIEKPFNNKYLVTRIKKILG